MKHHMKNTVSLLMLFAGVLIILTNCAYNIGLTQSMYKLLLTSQISYDTSMKIAASLYAKGEISTSDKTKIVEIGNIYSTAHNQAVVALANYERTKSETDQVRLTTQIEIATKALSKLLEMLQPYLEVN